MGWVEVVKALLEAQPAVPAPSAAAAAARKRKRRTPETESASAALAIARTAAGSQGRPSQIVKILINAVEAAITGKSYTTPAHPRCKWPCRGRTCGEETEEEAAREKCYPQIDECDWGQVTRLLTAAGADPSLEGGRSIKEAIRWCDESDSAVCALDALIDAKPDNPVITSGEACFEAIDGHHYKAACMLLPVTPPGAVEEMELGTLQQMAKSQGHGDMLRLVEVHLKHISG
jgi:hypothetical protein